MSQPAPGRNFADLFLRRSREPAVKKLPTAHELHLRSGDVVPCTVTTIDEEGLTIQSSVATATHVPHEKVKAVKLLPRVQPPELDEKKKVTPADRAASAESVAANASGGLEDQRFSCGAG